jgi:hypothetical protein
MRSAEEVVAEISSFSPVGDDWRPLDALLADLWEAGVRETHIPSLLRVFERYPDEDGSGVLWSIVHGIEALPFDYESALRDSMSRRVSVMGRVLLQRLENSRAA